MRKRLILSLAFVAMIISISFSIIPVNASTNASLASFFSDILIVTPSSKTMKIGDSFYISCFSTYDKKVRFKSEDSSIAQVNSKGLVTAKKSGTTKIICYVGEDEKYVSITVQPTTITLRAQSVELYRNKTYLLIAKSSTGHTPKFKCNRSSVCTVDSHGCIKAKKHGEAVIKVTVDDTVAYFYVTVLSPEITLSATNIKLKVGETYNLSAFCSSGNPVTWSVSNINVLSIDQSGCITPRQKGKAYVYAKEDGAKVSCIVTVTN